MKSQQIIGVIALIAIVSLVSAVGAYFFALQGINNSPSPTSTPTSTSQPTNSPTSTPQHTQVPTLTASPTSTPTATSSQIGYSRSNPAPAGTALTIQFDWIGDDYTAKITLLETIRGEQAWNILHEENMFNDPPAQGFEYILAKIRFEYLSGPTADTSYDVSPVFFDAISSSGVTYDYVTNVVPDPDLHTTLYPGATHEGWACYQVRTDDSNPQLSFGTNYDGTGGIWFKLS